MNKFFSFLKFSAQAIIIGVILLLAILAFTKTNFLQVSPGGALAAYPPPQSTANRVGYPGPSTATIPPHGDLSTSTPPIKPETTTVYQENKSNRPMTVSEKSDLATQIAQKNKNASEVIPSAIPYRFEISSPSSLAQIILGDPLLIGLRENESSCLKIAKPGAPYLIHSLNDYGDYYIIAFYNNNKVCGKAIIRIIDGVGEVAGWSGARETIFPQIGAEDAIYQVEKETQKKAISDPQLVYQDYPAFYTDPFNPYWQVETSDGNVYYVSFRRVLSEGGSESTVIQIKNANDLHPAK